MSSRFRFRRRNTWSGRSRGSYSRRRTGYGSSALVRRARGNMRAANQQNDSSSVVINLMHTCYAGCTIVQGSNKDTDRWTSFAPDDHILKVGTVAVNIYDLLRKSDFFGSYSGMYDQFRINSIKVKITPTQWAVFDQQQSINNYAGNGGGQSMAIDISQQSIPPLASEYVLNDDFVVNEDETSHNPKYIVPGIPPIQLNYVPIPAVVPDVEDEWASWRQAGINFVVNIKGGAGDANTFEDGTVVDWKQAQISDVADGINEKAKFIYPQALTVVTAWDRTGLSESQFVNVNEEDYGFFQYDDDNGELIHHAGKERFDEDDLNEPVDEEPYYVCSIGDNITSYSSAQTTQLVGGSKFNLVRYLYPSSQQEKSTYYSTNSLLPQLQRVKENAMHYLYGLDNDVEEGDIKPEKLCNLLESPVVPFKPTLLISILGHNETSSSVYFPPGGFPKSITAYPEQLIKPVKFNLEFDIGVTFRGLRKTQVV